MTDPRGMLPHLKRRRFLRSVSAGALALGSLGCSDELVLSDDDPTGRPDVQRYDSLLAGYFGESYLDAARLIGTYHATSAGLNVETAFASTLQVRALVDDLASEAAQVEALEKSLQQDFETLRIVDVDGWTLGQTEIDLCVLAALS